jgi:hypothetical protein
MEKEEREKMGITDEASDQASGEDGDLTEGDSDTDITGNEGDSNGQ